MSAGKGALGVLTAFNRKEREEIDAEGAKKTSVFSEKLFLRAVGSRLLVVKD
jgi:hypothetical protein